MRLLRGYISLVRPRWLGATIVTAATLLAGVVVTLLQDEVYRAEAGAVVSLRSQHLLSPGPEDDAELAEARATSYMNLARSMPVAERVAHDLRLDAAAAGLISRVDVTQPAGTVMLRVSAEGDSPLGAQQLANAWVEALGDGVQKLEGLGDKRRPYVSLTPYADAELPASPVSPDPVRNLVAALALGLLLGLAYALVRRPV